MTDRVEALALLLGSDAEDPELLNLLLEQADGEIMALTGRNEVPDALQSTAISLAAVYFNRRGMEGETKRAEGSVTRQNGGRPDDIVRAVRPYTLAKPVRA